MLILALHAFPVPGQDAALPLVGVALLIAAAALLRSLTVRD